jgi:hypothetical protein
MTKTTRMIVDNIYLGFQKSGTKSRGVLHFVPLRRFYAVLFIPLFCRLREKCGTLWKTTWLHNVDNIRQKDINIFKFFLLQLSWLLFPLFVGTMVNYTGQMQYRTLCRDKLTQQHSSGKSSYIYTIHSAAFFRKVISYSHKTFRGILKEGRLLFTQYNPRDSSWKSPFIYTIHTMAFFRKVRCSMDGFW